MKERKKKRKQTKTEEKGKKRKKHTKSLQPGHLSKLMEVRMKVVLARVTICR